MDEIGFPKNLPDEFKAYFAAAHNEIIYLKEKINTLTRMYFGQKSERHAKEELILPQGSLFNGVRPQFNVIHSIPFLP